MENQGRRRKKFPFLSVKERISGDIPRLVGTSLVGTLWTRRLRGPDAVVPGPQVVGEEVTPGGAWPHSFHISSLPVSRRLVSWQNRPQARGSWLCNVMVAPHTRLFRVNEHNASHLFIQLSFFFF